MDEMLSGANAMLAGAILAMTQVLKSAFAPFFNTALGQRVIPAVPVVLGVVAALGGFCDPAITRWQDRVVVGFLSGAAAGQLFKMGRTSVLGKGVSATASLPPPAPEPEPVPAPVDDPPPVVRDKE